MSKEEVSFIEASEEDDSASASAERHNDIECQNALLDKALEEAFGSYLETKNKEESGNKKNTKASTVIEDNDDIKEIQNEEEEGQQQRE
ncbi:hypothetical protein RFI_31877 [Reticulomyxa filosa]|uniref:Uncharacterized protein n=1 Tax=Reticulomyxa filosa TaxID=46433 RepID=X6LWK4_RETFI|nr:hypothetical protein RFI_31877 [Reticulomyxa filosa]|eukprot:ETO05517.1 hypothetical protein RFI_31877 [Reticulomyxa filosa]